MSEQDNAIELFVGDCIDCETKSCATALDDDYEGFSDRDIYYRNTLFMGMQACDGCKKAESGSRIFSPDQQETIQNLASFAIDGREVKL